MKRRVVAFVLCALMLFSSLPLTSLGGMTVAAADSADIETHDVNRLRELYNSVPRDGWKQYVDTSILETWYNEGEKVLENPEKYNQDYIDLISESLEKAISDLQYHTKDITLNETAANAEVGEKLKLVATLNPKNAADSITWTSSNNSVATVTPDGLVSVNAYNKNGVVITAESNGYTASCRIAVFNQLNGVKLSKTSNTLFETQSFTLTPTAIGKDSSAKTTDTVIYTWDSSNPKVASVSDSGKVTAKTKGTTTISVTAKSGDAQYKASCKVTVNTLVVISSLKVKTSLNSGVLPLTVNESTTFKVDVSPSNASIKDFKWSSSDTKIATVTAGTISGASVTANIKALKAGKAKISYSTTDGSNRSGSFTVEVKPLITFLSLSSSYKVITPNASEAKLTATIKPGNAGNQVLTWASSNPSVCDVDHAGVLIPKSKGTAVISAKTKDGTNLSSTCTVRVAEKASSVSLNKKSQSLKVGKTATLTATVKTTDGSTYNNVSWSSSNTKVATVSSGGVVKAAYPGTATITATTLDGTKKSVTCKVTVTAPVKGITLTAKKTIALDKTATLKPTFNPTYASNQNVTWKSSNTKVATVSSKGVVTGKKVGTATITCTTADGGYKASCTVSVVIKTTSIKLNKSAATIAAGKTLTLKATLAPSNATDKTVKWSSSNTKVAKVSSSGVVTAVAGGQCTITAKSSGGQTATTAVTVTQKVSGISLNVTSASLYTTRVYTIKPTVTPSTATNKNVTWTSSNSKVAKVDSSGVVTALAVGTATITAKTADGGYTARCEINVFQKVPVTGVKLSSTKLTLDKGKQTTLDTTISPNNASEKGITWSTNDKSVATVSSTGVVKAVKTGTAVITATTKDGSYTAKCTITVVQKATSVKLSATSLKVAVGKSSTLKATVNPSDATNKKVTWKIGNTAIAKISSSGVVTGVKAGVTTATVTTADGGYSATCNITVYNAVTGIKLNKNVLKVSKGETAILTTTVSPSSATNKAVTWTSSDKSVATVNSAGEINALKIGATVITAKTKDGGLTAECMVEVVQLATSVSLDYSSLTLSAGASKTLSATVKPSTASNKNVKWSTSNKNVATVDSAGKITAVGAGTATITAKSADGNASAKCKITVKQPITSIKLNQTTLYVGVGKNATLKATIGPSNATDKTIKWTTSDSSIATVSSNGTVKGVKLGTVTVTVTSSNGKVKATCKVQVVKPVTSVKLNKTSAKINLGKTVTLTATVSPSNATVKAVKWTSSNTKVATVDSKGKVTSKAPGTATITVTTTDGSFKATCKVTVHQPLNSIAFAKSSVTAEVGKKTKLTVNYSPSNASNKTLTWTTSDKSIATVASDGTVNGLKKGTVKITAKSAEGGYKITCTVKVVKKVTSVKLDKTSLTLYLGKTATLKATIAPTDASNKAVTWTSSDTSIVTVDKNGKLTPKKAGSATITVKSSDGGKTAKCIVKVERAATSIKLNKTSLSMVAGESQTLTSTLAPSDVTNKTITWSTSDKSIATVSAKGVVKAVKGGTATITAKSSNGLTVKCTVKITQYVSSVKFEKNEYSVYIGDTVNLKAIINPSSATNQSVTWKSSDGTVAAVSSNGVVSGIKEGEAKITVTTADGGKTATCVVKVLEPVTDVSLDASELLLAVGDSAALKAEVLPEHATVKTVTWKSSNANVVTVSSSGEIKAVGQGKAVITCTTNDGEKTAACEITVYEPVTGVSLDIAEKELYAGNEFILSAEIAPSDATNKQLIWTSSNANVVSVSDSGVVSAQGAGEAVVTVETADGGFKAECSVKVKQNATGISLNETSKTVFVGAQDIQLKASVEQITEGNLLVNWYSSDESVATVSADGVVSPIARGEAIITAKTVDSGFKAEFRIEVKQAANKVVFDEEQIEIKVGESKKLTAKVLPENTNDPLLMWSSSDESIAVVSDGTVTALKEGTVTITATVAVGSAKGTIIIHVVPAEEQTEPEITEVSLMRNS
ncbi:MAG: Ig-like domain-containing protein [Faecalibacterium sp.]|nr:Ig-like domain-containing protein [Ruminococcus sp.]MCM1391363.1 Ig-like domain-containing protein [Ruminococcus sp.]MCM1484573.1 Ig-like domain-containing protein [Faecalibacterium sp.]